MKHYNNPPAVEFEYNEDTYRVEADIDNKECIWWRVGSTHKIVCELADPAYQIIAPIEDWPVVADFGIYLNTEDMLDYGLFMARLNQAVRQFLPPDHPVRCKEVSERYKAQLHLPDREWWLLE